MATITLKKHLNYIYSEQGLCSAQFLNCSSFSLFISFSVYNMQKIALSVSLSITLQLQSIQCRDFTLGTSDFDNIS
jgi:hypothetical protein